MRVLHITAGTGSFYCGTCTRDNALVGALRGRGWDASLLPLYLPLRVDEEESTDCPLFFGGVNVFLQEKFSFFGRLPRWVRGVLDSRMLLNWTARFQHMTRAEDLGHLTISMLLAEKGNQNAELRRLIAWIKSQEPFDAVCLSNLLLAGMARTIRAELEIPVICTMQGEDTFLDGLPGDSSRRAWSLLAQNAAACDAFVAVSAYYRNEMIARLGLPAQKAHCVPNGIVLDRFEKAQTPPTPPCVGYLARLCPAKGAHLLVDAFIELKKKEAHKNLRLLLVGSCIKGDEPYLKQQTAKVEKAGVAGDVKIRTNVSREEKLALLRQMTLLSVPAVYGEAFGLYILEALASGVPVVQPDRGAFGEILEETGGGWLYDPDTEEPESIVLARRLDRSLADGEGLAQRAERGRRSVIENFDINRMARAIGRIYEETIAAFRRPSL